MAQPDGTLTQSFFDKVPTTDVYVLTADAFVLTIITHSVLEDIL